MVGDNSDLWCEGCVGAQTVHYNTFCCSQDNLIIAVQLLTCLLVTFGRFAQDCKKVFFFMCNKNETLLVEFRQVSFGKVRQL